MFKYYFNRRTVATVCKIQLARSMKERCERIKECGGLFYENSDQCPELAGL